MAIASIGARGTGVAGATASTTVTMSPSATVAVGRILVVAVVSPTATHASVTDTGGNEYSKLAESSGNSQTTSVWFTKVTTQLTTGSTITATFGSSVAEKCIGAREFSVASGFTLQESAVEQVNTSTGSGFGSLAFSSLSSKERLFFRACGKNANSTTALTATASPAFTSLGWTIRSRNNTAARVLRGEFRIETSTGVTSNPTFAVTGNYATAFVALEEVAEPATLTPSSAGTSIGAQGPTLAVHAAPAAAGVTVGAQAPSLAIGATLAPAAAGVELGANAPTLDAAAPTTALGGVDANVDKLTQQTDLPASLLQPYTITGWFKRTTNANEGGPACVWNGSSYNTLLVNTSGMARVGSNLGGVDVAAVAVDTWYFFALVQSGATRQLTGYIGGLSGGLSSGTHTSVNDAAAVTDIIVGGGPYFGQQVRGSITEFRVWTRALSAAEVEAERDGQRTAASSTNLVGRYPLLDADTKLEAALGTDLLTTGAGAWTTDSSGPFVGGGSATLTPSAAGAEFGAQLPELAAGVSPAAAGLSVGAQAPALAAAVAPGAPGALVGAQAPILAATVEPAAAGALAGAQVPTLAAGLAAAAAGAAVGAQLPELAAGLAPADAGLAVGAQAPALAVTVAPSAAGADVGAQAPALAATVEPAAAGALAGAAAPSLSVTLVPSYAGTLAGAYAPSVSSSLTVEAAGALVGAPAVSLAAGVSPSAAGLQLGAWSPTVAGGPGAAQLEPELAGVVAGGWSPTLAVVVAAAPAGFFVGAVAIVAGELVPRYVRPGELVRVQVLTTLAEVSVTSAAVGVEPPAPATVSVHPPAAGATPS